MYKINVIIPVLYHDELTDLCLKSLVDKHDLSICDFEIIIINNECDIKTSNLIKKYSKTLHIKEIKNEKNTGVSASWNIGIRESNYDHIAIINNDIEFGFDNSLYKMADTLNQNSNIYWTSPITYYNKNQKTITSFQITHYEQLKYGSKGNSYVVGCCFMCPAKSFKDIGLFDEKMHMKYYEDLDYINRILQVRKKVKMTTNAAVYHAVGSTSRFVKGGENNENYYKYKWGNSQFDILKLQGPRIKGAKHFS